MSASGFEFLSLAEVASILNCSKAHVSNVAVSGQRAGDVNRSPPFTSGVERLFGETVSCCGSSKTIE